MNFNHKNYSENFKKFFPQEEIDKMSYNEKFFPTCKCGKKEEFRWKKSDLECDRGMFYAIAPFKGKNGEEVCHKCAPCVKCGKENHGNLFSAPHVKTGDNPSGQWALAYCSFDCFHGTEKSSLPKKEPRQVENCNYCGKLTEVKFGNSPTEKTFCSRDCYVAAGNKIHKGKCRIAGCYQTAYYECMDLCLGHSKPCRGMRMGKKCSLALGSDEGDFCGLCKNQNERVDKKENSRNCSHCGKLFAGEIQYSCSPCGTIYCSKDCCETSAPQCKNKQDKESQDNQVKPVKFIVDSEKNLDKSLEKLSDEAKNQMLIINLRSVKQITLTSDNNLVIEFNKTETNSASQEVKIVNDMQINNSRELQKVKSYLQENGEKSISQQGINSILSSDSTNTGITDKPDNYTLAVGLSVIFVLSGLTIGLLVRRKLKAVRK